MFEKYIGWHLELTRRCAIACPACPRTYNAHLYKNLKKDLPLEDIKNFFHDKNYIKEIEYMMFCGTLGDPIYHPKFHEISEWFFDAKDLAVITNGVHNINFWSRVLETWPSNSKITLSIDGLKDTNHIYRVNSKWESIEQLLSLISKKKHKSIIEWKFIVFEHNYHQIDEAKKLSEKVGIDIFKIQKTRPLNNIPNIPEHIKEYHMEEYFEKQKFENIIVPWCYSGDMHYIDADGFYAPCCWFGNEKTFWNHNIKNYSIENLYNEFVNFSKKHLENGFDNAPKACKNFCKKIVNNKLEYIAPNTQVNRRIIKHD